MKWTMESKPQYTLPLRLSGDEPGPTLQPSESATPPGPPPPPPQWSRHGSSLASLLKTLALALLIFLAVRAAVQNFVIQGPSMLPNLTDGELMLVEKVSYRIHPPRRGDILVFRSHSGGDKFIIKRVIALPGETVEMRNGKPFICKPQGTTQKCWTLEEKYAQLRPGEYTGTLVVPPDRFFVLGDNRAHSTDSRSPSVGPIAREDIVGRAWFSLWPLQELGLAPNYSWADKP